MFSDPQSITISGTTTSLPATFRDGAKSQYKNPDSSIVETVQHSFGRRNRSTLALVISKYAQDPLYPVQNRPLSMTLRITADRPSEGFTVAEQKAAWDALLVQLAASSGALTTKFLGGEG